MSSIIEKVAALLRQAEHPNTSPAEAEAFSAKAHALAAREGITAAVIAAAAGIEEEGGIVQTVITIDGTYATRKVSLACAVAKATGCQSVFHTRNRFVNGRNSRFYSVRVVGTVADTTWAGVLYDSLAKQLGSAIAFETKHRGASGGTGRKFGTAFAAGFAHQIATRLAQVNSEARKEAEETAATAGTTSVAVVLANKASRVEAEFKKAFPNTVASKVSRTTSRSGYDAGQSVARDAAISRGGVGGGAGQKAIG